MKKHTFKSCCGSKVMILETDKPIRKSHIPAFKGAGYLAPDNFYNAGLLYIQKTTLIATGSFGTNRINVRCSGPDCDSRIAEFEKLLEEIVKS